MLFLHVLFFFHEHCYSSKALNIAVIFQYDLVCEDAYLSGLATTIYFCGVMVGGIIFGSLSDRFGRKPFMLLTLYLHILVGVGIPFSPTYSIFVISRFILGILLQVSVTKGLLHPNSAVPSPSSGHSPVPICVSFQGLHMCTFVLIMELVAPEYRTPAATVLEVFWGLGIILLALVSYALQDWRRIQLTFAVVNVVTVVFLW